MKNKLKINSLVGWFCRGKEEPLWMARLDNALSDVDCNCGKYGIVAHLHDGRCPKGAAFKAAAKRIKSCQTKK